MVETNCPSHLQVVKKGHHELKLKTRLLSLPEELQVYILHFLPCRDILRCTSVSHNFVLILFVLDVLLY